jgi:hypothetical protein
VTRQPDWHRITGKGYQSKGMVMKFSKAFSGVVDGDVYPTEFKKGQDCPKELETAATDAGAIGEKSAKQIAAELEAEAAAEAEAQAAAEAAADAENQAADAAA